MKYQPYNVIINKKTLKGLSSLPFNVQQKLNLLVKDLRDLGPILTRWPNFSKLGNDKYHCHLGYSWVACWKNIKGTLIIEVYYVGSRESAPY